MIVTTRKTPTIIPALYSSKGRLCKHAPGGFVSSQRQRECKARARPWGTFHLDAAMMRLYHLFDDSQTETGAAGCARARGVGAIKAFKNVGQVFLRSTTG